MAASWLALLTGASASACPLCFGGLASNNAGMFRGIFISGVILVALTFSIIGALAAAVYRIERSRHD